jgi:hypothetical protein
MTVFDKIISHQRCSIHQYARNTLSLASPVTTSNPDHDKLITFTDYNDITFSCGDLAMGPAKKET